MKFVLSLISLCLIIGIGSALQCVEQSSLHPKDVAITIHHCPSFAKSCFTTTTLHNVKRGCSTEFIGEKECEINYASPKSETCSCNTDLCNSPKWFEGIMKILKFSYKMWSDLSKIKKFVFDDMTLFFKSLYIRSNAGNK